MPVSGFKTALGTGFTPESGCGAFHASIQIGKEHAVIRIWKSGCQDPDLGQGMPGSGSQYCACPDPFRKVHDRIQIWDSTCLDPDLGYYRAMPGCIFETAHARAYMWESACQDPDLFWNFIPTEFHYACLFSGKFVSFSEYAHTNVHSIDQGFNSTIHPGQIYPPVWALFRKPAKLLYEYCSS